MSDENTRIWYEQAVKSLEKAPPGTLAWQLRQEAEGALKALAQGLPVRIPAKNLMTWANNVQAANPNTYNKTREYREEVERYLHHSDIPTRLWGHGRGFDPSALDKVDNCG